MLNRPARELVPLDIPPSHTADAVLPLGNGRKVPPGRGPVIVIGASTGGTEALKVVLAALPENCPPVLVAQHMPALFTRSFATRLDSLCRVQVKEAESGEPVRRGTVYIAPGHSHILLQWGGDGFRIQLSQAVEVNRHRPSVDVLFRSAANELGEQAIGVILTGMGRDGARGMLEMREAGAHTLAQDEASCVVFGMPKEALALGGVQEVLPIERIGGRLVELTGPALRF